MADLIEESTKNLVQEIAFTNPNKLKEFKNYEDLGNYYLPRSIGIEFECFLVNESSEFANLFLSNLKSVDGIIECKSDTAEQRFRISKGFKGMCALYSALGYMNSMCELNSKSGIHYHVDLTDVYDSIDWIEFKRSKSEYLLSELDSWNYNGTYNARDLGISYRMYWLACRNIYKTIECRIGEMTFDYSLIMKRIFHLTTIIETALGDLTNIKQVSFYKKLERDINQELSKFNLPKTLTPEEEVKQIIKSRKIKL